MYQLLMSGTTASRFFQVIPVVALCGGIYILVWAVRWRKRKNRVTREDIVRFLFVCYITGLVSLVLTPNNLWTALWFYLFNGYPGCEIGPLMVANFNFTPTIALVLRGELILGEWVKTMLILNFLMYMPMGIFLRLILKRSYRKYFIIIACSISLVIELLQPVVGRSFDIDDIILNSLGIICGWVIISAMGMVMEKRRTA